MHEPVAPPVAPRAELVTWAGAIDRANATSLIGPMIRAFANRTRSRVVIDLSRVTFLDSIGLGVLVQARTESLATGIPLTLRAVTPQVRRLIVIAGIDTMFEFEDAHPTWSPDPSELPPRPLVLPDEAETVFAELAALAASLVAAPIALISLIDANQQRVLGSVGLPPEARRGTSPLTHSVCQHVVARAAPLTVRDSRDDPLFAANPALRDLDLVAYLGVPITDASGATVGALCAMDARPRDWTDREISTLRLLARIGGAEIGAQAAARADLSRLSQWESIDNRLTALAALVDPPLDTDVSEIRAALRELLPFLGD